jgi:hypothetical protein
MIRFQCQHCAANLTVQENRAGTIGRCPRCKQAITIPQAPTSEPDVPDEDEELTLVTPPAPKDKALFDLPDGQELADLEAERLRHESQLITKLGISRQPQYTGERRFPWPIDVLLYPTSGPGLMVLALLTGAPLLLEAIRRFMPILGHIGLVFYIGSFVLGLYAAWYLAECVYDSARGGTRAPEFTGAGLGEMWSRVSYLLAVYIVYLLPVVLYKIVITGFDVTGAKLDIIFWILAGYALLFFPMALLAMVVNDSISALNPFFLLGSMARAFFQYAGLLLFFAALAVLFWLSTPSEEQRAQLRPFWLEAVGLAIANYTAFVVAHVLGRFYWRNRERLDWGL